MADAYNVRVNGDRYYVYRLDGNVQVNEFMGPGAAAKAQREAAIRNQRHNEQFGKKKDDQSHIEHTESWIEGGDENQPETVTGHQDRTPTDTHVNPTKGVTPSESEAPLSTDSTSEPRKPGRPKKEVPNPPPGQGTSY